jgi:hypothetical protein
MASLEDSQHVAIFLDRTSELVLAENDVQLLDALRNQGLDVSRAARRPPNAPPLSSGEKGAELLILCSAGAAPLIAAAVVRVLEGLGIGRKAVVTERSWTAAYDTDGKPMVNRDGSVVMEWRETSAPASEGRIFSQATTVKFLGLTVSITDKAAPGKASNLA